MSSHHDCLHSYIMAFNQPQHTPRMLRLKRVLFPLISRRQGKGKCLRFTRPEAGVTGWLLFRLYCCSDWPIPSSFCFEVSIVDYLFVLHDSISHD
jgi:hypothetical protein